MAIFKIITAPNPILKKKSEPVTMVDDEIRKLMDNMLETMYNADGIGLAAVQIGVHKRVLVMDVGNAHHRYKAPSSKQSANSAEGNNIETDKGADARADNGGEEESEDNGKNNMGVKFPLFMANPEIIWHSNEKNTYEEGCLSFPGQFSSVVRPKQVKIKFLDYHNKEQILQADELLATCVQHEIDHLNGVVFIDHISAIKRQRILKKLAKQK